MAISKRDEVVNNLRGQHEVRRLIITSFGEMVSSRRECVSAPDRLR